MIAHDTERLAALTPKERAYFLRSRRMLKRFPGGARLFSIAHRDFLRLTRGRIGGTLLGVPIALLATTGRQSGRTRTVPIVYLDDESRFLVVASNSGLDSPPAWYLNLRAHPDAQIRTRTGIERVVARELTAPEREEVWPSLLVHNPMWGAYQSCTERQSAVVALERTRDQRMGQSP
jgi:F420H(2)-dependent quinone reductase